MKVYSCSPMVKSHPNGTLRFIKVDKSTSSTALAITRSCDPSNQLHEVLYLNFITNTPEGWPFDYRRHEFVWGAKALCTKHISKQLKVLHCTGTLPVTSTTPSILHTIYYVGGNITRKFYGPSIRLTSSKGFKTQGRRNKYSFD
jgi:hypothetical protein